MWAYASFYSVSRVSDLHNRERNHLVLWRLFKNWGRFWSQMELSPNSMMLSTLSWSVTQKLDTQSLPDLRKHWFEKESWRARQKQALQKRLRDKWLSSSFAASLLCNLGQSTSPFCAWVFLLYKAEGSDWMLQVSFGFDIFNINQFIKSKYEWEGLKGHLEEVPFCWI